MAPYDSLHESEADACPFELGRAVQPLKYAEQLLLIPRVETDAVVLDGIDDLAVARGAGHLDDRVGARARVLDRVAEQIHPDLFHQRRVAHRMWELADAQINHDRNLRLQFLAGLGLNQYNEAAIYSQMLQYRRYPEGLFAGSPERLAQIRMATGGY